MYTITDVVEMGYLTEAGESRGGSIQITLEFQEMLDEEAKKSVLTVIDSLDHCLVTSNKSAVQYSVRHFLLSNSVSQFHDIHTILHELLHTQMRTCAIPVLCTVRLGKESFSAKLQSYSEIVTYRVEG